MPLFDLAAPAGSQASAPSQSPLPSAPSGRMNVGDRLYVGQRILSSDYRMALTLQSDGNLVLIKDDGTPLWDAGLGGKASYFATLQSDGNFVVYDASMRPLWAAGVQPNVDHLQLQTDGNMVIYDKNGNPTWYSNTRIAPAPPGYISPNSPAYQAALLPSNPPPSSSFLPSSFDMSSMLPILGIGALGLFFFLRKRGNK